MEMRKRLSFLLVGISLVILPVAVYAKDFPDVQAGSWAATAIDQMSNYKYILGSTDGNFYPGKPVTRAEFSAMVVRSLKLTPVNSKKPSFTDVSAKSWAYNSIETSQKAGYITGYGGKFRPEDKITREELAAISMRISAAYGYSGGYPLSNNDKYLDNQLIAAWAQQYVADASSYGYLEEVSYTVYSTDTDYHRYNQVFAPKGNATRAQAAYAMYNLLVRTGQI